MNHIKNKMDKKDLDTLIIFFDGKCPLCTYEMQQLIRFDTHHQISLIDLHSQAFTQYATTVNFTDAMKILHGHYKGKTLLGLAVTHRAWTIVGKGFWFKPLNWPVIKQIAHGFYLFFALFRQDISRLLARIFKININQCTSEVCDGKKTQRYYRSK